MTEKGAIKAMDGYMNVVLRLENQYHLQALAKRLVQLTDRIRINIVGPEQNMEWKEKDVLYVDDELAAACSSASALLEKLKFMYTEKTGERLCCAPDAGPAIVGVGSAAGGSGTTAAALTLARLLAGRLKGETLLIFAGGSGNPLVYLETSEEHEGSKGEVKREYKDQSELTGISRELDYMLSHNLRTDIMKYIKRDRYGPFAAACTAPPRLLLDRLEKLAEVEAAVIDFGTSCGGRTAGCHVFAEVAARGDLRAAEFREKAADSNFAASHYSAAAARLFILNKAAAMDQTDRLFCVPYDRESFRATSHQIEIAMDGLYAAAMRKAADKVIETISEIRNMKCIR